jgi:hypothetical protein
MAAIVATLFLRVTTYCGAFLLPENPDLTGYKLKSFVVLHLRLLSSIHVVY